MIESALFLFYWVLENSGFVEVFAVDCSLVVLVELSDTSGTQHRYIVGKDVTGCLRIDEADNTPASAILACGEMQRFTV